MTGVLDRSLRQVLLAAAGALLVILSAVGLPAKPAGAHGDVGTLGIEATVEAPLTVHVRTLLRYASDGHTVPGASVGAVATGADGTSVGPVVLTDTGDGTYTGDLTVPGAGAWTVVATAAVPAAEARAAVVVPAVTPSTTISEPVTPSTTARTSDRAARDGSDPLVPVVKYLVVVLGVALITATVWVALRTRR